MSRQLPAGRTRELAIVLHDIGRLLPRSVDPVADADLEPLPASELEVLRLVVRRRGLSVGEVARELRLQPSNASAAIRALLARGLLERAGDGRDRRISRLIPTPRAQAIWRQTEAAWGAFLRGRLARLTPEDAAELLRAVDALSALAAHLGAD